MRGKAGAVLYTRKGCPLCFALGRLAERSSRRHDVGLVEADVDSEKALRERYGNEVPVLVLPGGTMVSGRAAAGEVDEAFARAAVFLRGLEGGGPGGPHDLLRRGRPGTGWIRRLFGSDRPEERTG